MTPLEKALDEKGKVNYCDECERCVVVGDAAYCEADGKLLHPIMFIRGEGTGPAWACKKREKPRTNFEAMLSKPIDYMALYLHNLEAQAAYCGEADSVESWLEWLRSEEL